MGRLAGKVAVVTGAGSIGPGWGNGKAVATLFAREGAAIAALDISEDAARETADLIEGEGGRCLPLRVDVTASADVAAAVEHIVDAFGGIDVLHNNVGTLALGGPVEASEESWRHVMDVNLTSMFLTSKHILPKMLARGQGAIVNVSSIIADVSLGPHYISYSSSKGGVNSFTRAVAIEYADRNIRCNAIMPGLMRTPMVEKTLGKGLLADELDAMVARREKAVPMGRMGDAWDVARMALFLAGDESAYVTGQIVAVDGGVILRSVGF